MKIRDCIPVSLGEKKARVLVRNARILNVFTGEIELSNIAIFRRRIAGIGDYTEADHIIDAEGQYVLPGFIDAHLHIESSMLVPRQFAKAVLLRGTTTLVADPHEIGNILGTEGLEYMIQSTDGIPLNVYIAVPSAVPATRFETSGAYLGTDEMIYLLDRFPKRIIALGEVMNYPAVLDRDRELITKIEILRHRYKKIEGHAPQLSGKRLNAYLCAFIRSDHECSTKEEALEKVSRGMQVFIREGSAAKDLDALIGAVTQANHQSFSFCTDDRDPLEILTEGHIDYLVRRAIEHGVEPLIAVRMATINTARYFGLRSMGAVAPGYKADMLFVDDLEKMSIRTVIKDGNVVVRDQQLVAPIKGTYSDLPESLGHFNIPEIPPEALCVKAQPGRQIRVVRVMERSLMTSQEIVEPCVENGMVVADPKRDIAKFIVIDRHQGKSYSVGFIQGLGIRRGAVATSVGHDAHNLCVAGMNDDDIMLAIHWVAEQGGGLAVAKDGEIRAALELPVAGLMSNRSLFDVTARLKELRKELHGLGTEKEVFMTLSFVQLAVIPSLRMTDRGLVDVEQQRFVDLFV
ncbi:MAG: adenine deaminase [Proteobacteria bacterium]|jgi:adenine deaminase|nr:adenine deaminase [Pseudomonadota bacterium]